MRPSAAGRLICLIAPVLVLLTIQACAAGRAEQTGGVPDVVIGVLDFKADGLSLTEAREVTDRVRFLLNNLQGIRTIERDQMTSMLSEAGFQLSGACQTDACAIQVGKILGAHMMVAGSVAKAANFFNLQLRLVDVGKARMVDHAFRDVVGMEGLLTEGVEGVVADLAPEIRSAGPPLQ